MIVTITAHDLLTVTIEADAGYAPDVMADLAARARETFKVALADYVRSTDGQ